MKALLKYFSELKLVEYSRVDGNRNFDENIDPSKLANQDYACGMFWFRKE